MNSKTVFVLQAYDPYITILTSRVFSNYESALKAFQERLDEVKEDGYDIEEISTDFVSYCDGYGWFGIEKTVVED